jgi:hypothetical protein
VVVAGSTCTVTVTAERLVLVLQTPETYIRISANPIPNIMIVVRQIKMVCFQDARSEAD